MSAPQHGEISRNQENQSRVVAPLAVRQRRESDAICDLVLYGF